MLVNELMLLDFRVELKNGFFIYCTGNTNLDCYLHSL